MTKKSMFNPAAIHQLSCSTGCIQSAALASVGEPAPSSRGFHRGNGSLGSRACRFMVGAVYQNWKFQMPFLTKIKAFFLKGPCAEIWRGETDLVSSNILQWPIQLRFLSLHCHPYPAPGTLNGTPGGDSGKWNDFAKKRKKKVILPISY